MVRDMKIEIIGSETIKPSSPIPHDNYLKAINLSLYDQLGSPDSSRLILFYSIKHHQTISQQLKKSLSETLTLFYPFSGRIKSNTSIEFDEIGANYIEARTNCTISSFLERPDIDAVQHFYPADPVQCDSKDAPLLQVQVNFFECGGLAISSCVTHKLSDAATMCKFISVWAAIAFGHGQQQQQQQKEQEQVQLPLVEFNAASHFPPRQCLSTYQHPAHFSKDPTKCVTKRFVFYGTKIEALRARASSSLVQRPSRVEAITALIWRCAMAASGSPNKRSIMLQMANIRKRVREPFLENTMGNLVQHFSAITEEAQVELPDLVARLRQGSVEFGKNIDKLLSGDELLAMIDRHNKEKEKKSSTEGVDGGEEELEMMKMKLYSCSSWCRYGVYDVADFGWGKPVWMISPNNTAKNFFKLMDTKDGDGIEAFITLSDEDMGVFEKDPEFLAFATPNPSVL